MAAVGGRVDKPVAAVGAHQPVPGPEVAVQPGRRLRVAAQLGESAGDGFEVSNGSILQRQTVLRQASERQESLRRIELGPGPTGLVGQASAAGGTTVLAAEARCPGSVQRGQPAAERDLGVGHRAALLDPLEHQEGRVVRHREDGWHGDSGRLADPGKARRFGAEVIRRGRRVGLGEDPTSILEIQTKRDRHVAAVHARRTCDAGVELNRDVLENLLHLPRSR